MENATGLEQTSRDDLVQLALDQRGLLDQQARQLASQQAILEDLQVTNRRLAQRVGDLTAQLRAVEAERSRALFARAASLEQGIGSRRRLLPMRGVKASAETPTDRPAAPRGWLPRQVQHLALERPNFLSGSLALLVAGTVLLLLSAGIITFYTVKTSAAVSRAARPPKPLLAAPAGRVATPRRADVTTSLPNMSADAAEALVDQAIGLLVDHYVDALTPRELYQAAYDGTLITLQVSGKAPVAQPLTFSGDRKRDAAVFKRAYLALTAPLGSEVNQRIVAHEAINAVVNRLNECHTYFLDPEQSARAKAINGGASSYVGIGIQTNPATRPVAVSRVYPGSPAELAGVREGDQIVAIDGADIAAWAVDQVGPLLQGPEGSALTLTLRREGAPVPLVITVTRARVTIPTFDTRIVAGPNGERIGYMALLAFSAQTTRSGIGDGVERDLQKALEEFNQQGVSGWVLDLRNNPGGYVATLARFASRFIKDGQPVAYYVRADGQEEAITTDRRAYFPNQRPLAVLVNAGSGSSAEAFAAAGQDYGFARIFGEKTAGCLAAGRAYDLADGSSLNITVEKVISPSRREINQLGILPDELVLPDPTGASDPALAAALRWLASNGGR